MKIRAHVFVSGTVHHVFFRAETRDRARSLGLSGFVRNLPDGRVEAVFEGEEEKVREAVQFCRSGPPGARVENTEVRKEEYKGEFQTFGILY